MNINVKRNGREKLVTELKRLDAERVFLALDTYELDEEKRRHIIEELQDNCEYLKAEGFEVGAWIWTFWIRGNTSFRCMRAIDGTEISEFMCPTDEKFVEFSTEYMKDIARTGVDIIMFDDDFRYGFLSGNMPACLCDEHIRHINEMTDSSLTREEIYDHIINGKPNKYRDAYLKANGDAFRSFACAARKAVNEVDPKIRMGSCACMSSWDVDGTDAAELARILAGDTKPFVRLIGAPYWAVNKSFGNSLQDVIELERMESTWTKSDDIEIFSEGDAYPRPRINCPASYVEGFDTALRAAGCTDGILKYGIDYWSNADYETGYARRHERNRKLYGEIEEMFGNKKSCGIRVYESMKKISSMVNPTAVNSSVNIQNLFFPIASRLLAYNTIPTTYEGDGVCGIVFDENARHIPLDIAKRGLILDISAAEILAERGIDVGIEKIGSAVGGNCEYFPYNGNNLLTYGTAVYDTVLKEGAEVLSYVETHLGNTPASFRYENAEGSRFFILNMNSRGGLTNLMMHYERSRQLAEQAKWISGNKLPAYVYGNPALYMQCKKNDSAMAVGLWNFFDDTVMDGEVKLDKAYSSIRFVNCSGRLEGDTVYLDDITPFAFAGFEVK